MSIQYFKKLLFLSIVLVSFTYPQDVGNQSEIIRYLEKSVSFLGNVLNFEPFEKISDAQLFEGRVVFRLDEESWQNPSRDFIFLKFADKVIPVYSKRDIIELPEFVSSLKNEYRLKSEEDGILLQTLFYYFDNESSDKGFFQKDNRWYFIRNVFFDDVRGYIVTTDDDGKIAKIDLIGEGFKIPDEEEFSNSRKRVDFDYGLPIEIEEADSIYIFKYLKDNVKYRFELDELKLAKTKLPEDAEMFRGKLVIDESNEEYTGYSTYDFNLLKVKDQFAVGYELKDIIETDLFQNNILKTFKLKTAKDAKAFEIMLNEFAPVPENEISKLANYKKDPFWVFVREKINDSKHGYIVMPDKNGNAKLISYSELNETGFIRAKMKDENYKIDFGFKLKDPKTNIVTLTEGNTFYVSIVFNEKYVNAANAWVMTYFKGEMTGIYAGTNISSPFTCSIPGDILTVGTHTVDYLLMPPGDDISKAFERITFTINVVPKN